jgi:hypothetical protein
MKPCAFRPTSKTEQTIQKFERANPKKKRGAIINDIIEAYKDLSEGPAPPSRFPIRAYCPSDRQWYLLETLMQECQNCQLKKNCMAWHAYGSPPTIK